MKHLAISIFFVLTLILSFEAFALNEKKIKSTYFEKLFQSRVQELLEIEFSIKKQRIKPNQKLLLKRLKELMDKETQTI